MFYQTLKGVYNLIYFKMPFEEKIENAIGFKLRVFNFIT